MCLDVRMGVCSAVCFRQVFPQAFFDAVQEVVQHGVLKFGVVEVIA